MLIKLLRPFKKFAGKCIRLAYKLTYRLFKVDDKLAIFISFHGRGYSDNPKAIYEQMRQDPRFDGYRFIWFIKNLIEKKDEILSDAREQAASILDKAQIQTDELVNEHEIMQRAYEQAAQTIQAAQNQAQEIVDRAAAEANEMRSAAVAYTDQMLASLQLFFEHSVETNKEQYGSLMSKLNDTLHVVVNNRNELRGQSEPESDAQDVQH